MNYGLIVVFSALLTAEVAAQTVQVDFLYEDEHEEKM